MLYLTLPLSKISTIHKLLTYYMNFVVQHYMYMYVQHIHPVQCRTCIYAQVVVH